MFLFLLMPFSAYAAAGSVSVDVDGQEYVIGIDTEGVAVQSIESDGELALLLTVNATGSSGTLEITFEREFFDSTFQGEDDSFFVILDGFDEAVFEETQTDSTRTLLITIPSGTQEIEIIGSQILDGTFGEISSGTEPEVIEEPIVTEEPEVIEEPIVTEEPEVIEEPKVIEESTKCGPGTVLKDGACVLEDACGLGTHLEDGVCVLDEPASSGSSLNLPPMGQLIYGAAAAFVIAFIVIIFLWIISRGSREQQLLK
jgi:hypothetical protein